MSYGRGPPPGYRGGGGGGYQYPPPGRGRAAPPPYGRGPPSGPYGYAPGPYGPAPGYGYSPYGPPMSRGGPPTSGPPPYGGGHPTPSPQLPSREVHIGSLLRSVPVIRRSECVFWAPLKTRGRDMFHIEVTLPDAFPQAKPLCRMTKEAVHPSVDPRDHRTIVRFDKIDRWNGAELLGDVVLALLRSLEAPFPTPYSLGPSSSSMSSSSSSLPSPTTPSPSPSPSSSSTTTSLAAKKFTELSLSEIRAKYADAFRKVEDMSADELQKMNDDPESVFSFIQTLDPVKKVVAERDALEKTNCEIARETLSHKEALMEGKTKLDELNEGILSLQQQKETLVREIEGLRKKRSPMMHVKKLVSAVREMEDETESLEKDFLNTDMEVKDFVKTYTKQRSLFYMRKQKLQWAKSGAQI